LIKYDIRNILRIHKIKRVEAKRKISWRKHENEKKVKKVEKSKRKKRKKKEKIRIK